MIESGNQKIGFRILFILFFFWIPHTSLLVNFYIDLIRFRYFFTGSNMCHNTNNNVYRLILVWGIRKKHKKK